MQQLFSPFTSVATNRAELSSLYLLLGTHFTGLLLTSNSSFHSARLEIWVAALVLANAALLVYIVAEMLRALACKGAVREESELERFAAEAEGHYSQLPSNGDSGISTTSPEHEREAAQRGTAKLLRAKTLPAGSRSLNAPMATAF